MNDPTDGAASGLGVLRPDSTLETRVRRVAAPTDGDSRAPTLLLLPLLQYF